MTQQRPALAEVLAALTEREEANDHALIVRWWQRDEGASGMATARVVISDRGARFAYETNDRRPMTVLGPLSRWAHALRALAVGEGPTPQPTGVHLVGLDASRIVLAVEAL